ncbi:MAG TPA: DUF3293 domain-containing protein [bacterium]|jgi:hypothetical protein|nr:DUF3293 domain-containing protein [bacterium]
MPPQVPKDRYFVVPPGPNITPELKRAYLGTSYRVASGPASFVLRIGDASPALARVMAERGLDCAVGITAHNPRSRILGRDLNEAAHLRLLQKLAEQPGRFHLDGMNEDRGGLWPSEKSVLVPGMSLLEGLALAREFGQLAIVYAGQDAIPRLAFCRAD